MTQDVFLEKPILTATCIMRPHSSTLEHMKHANVGKPVWIIKSRVEIFEWSKSGLIVNIYIYVYVYQWFLSDLHRLDWLHVFQCKDNSQNVLRITSQDIERIIPAHFDAPVAATAKDGTIFCPAGKDGLSGRYPKLCKLLQEKLDWNNMK